MACGDVDDPSLGTFYSDGDGANHIEENRFSLVDGTPDAVGVSSLMMRQPRSLHSILTRSSTFVQRVGLFITVMVLMVSTVLETMNYLRRSNNWTR